MGFLSTDNAADPSHAPDDNLFVPADPKDNRLVKGRKEITDLPRGAPEMIQYYEEEVSKYHFSSFQANPGLCKFVGSARFESIMAIPILYNCITIAVSANCSHECRTGQNFCNPCDEGTKVFLQVSEHFLTFIFVVEWCVRMYVFGPKWLKEPFNFIDSALVLITGVLIVWILEPAGVAPDSMRSVQVMRAFRLLRLSRVVKSLPEFKEMWMLVTGLADSMNTLFWSVVLILFLLYIFGIVATELIAKDTDAYDLSNEEEAAIHSLWSSIPVSMFTLIQFMTLDSWSGVARPMMERQPYIWMFFMVFISIATFVLMNLVTAVIVNNALDITKKDEEAAVLQMENEKKEEFEQLGDLFYNLDADGSGSVDKDEFQSAFEVPEVANKLKVLEFEEAELMKLFEMIDKDGGGEIELEEFLFGLRQMKGNAKSKDMMALRSITGRCFKSLNVVVGRKEGDPVSQFPKLSMSTLAPGPFRNVEAMLDELGQQVAAMEERFLPAPEEDNDSKDAPEEVEQDSHHQVPKLDLESSIEASADERIVCTDPELQKLADGIMDFRTWGHGINDQLSRLAQCLDAMAEQDQAAKALGQFATAGRRVKQQVAGLQGLQRQQDFRAGTAPLVTLPEAAFPLPGQMQHGTERAATSPEIIGSSSNAVNEKPTVHFQAPHFNELREAARGGNHDQASRNLRPSEVLI